MLRGLDICAGSGIGSLAFERAGLSRTVCYIERDPYCQRIIEQRQRDGWLSPAPIWDDLRTFDGRPWRGRVDFIFGGIPCQPWSLAGKQQGAADERDLWPDTRRIIREVGPRLVLIENVPGLLVRGLGRILGDIAEDGYDAEWATVSAADVGAWHLRKRVWIVAYPRGTGRQQVAGGAHGDEGADEGRPPTQADELERNGEGGGAGDVAYAASVNGEWPVAQRDRQREPARAVGDGSCSARDIPDACRA